MHAEGYASDWESYGVQAAILDESEVRAVVQKQRCDGRAKWAKDARQDRFERVRVEIECGDRYESAEGTGLKCDDAIAKQSQCLDRRVVVESPRLDGDNVVILKLDLND